jgi:hypothetical protein
MSFLSILNPFRKAAPAASPVASPTASPPLSPPMLPPPSPNADKSRCDSEGFYQHLGECWNDSIQMIFLFSDGLKEIVQPALLDPNFDSKVESIINNERNKLYFLFNSDLKGLNTTNLGAVNNPFANNSTKAVLGSKVRERKNAITEYFKVLKKRFMRHYNNEAIRRESCDLKSDNEHRVFQRMSEISRAAGQDGIAAAALGHINTRGVNRSHINIEELKKKSEEKKYGPGGNIYDEYYLFNLYKLVFFSNYQFNFSLFQSTFTMKEKKLNYSIDLSKISNDIINNSKAIFIASSINNEKGHATAFYTCGGSEIYYDDNTGIYPFRWKEFLLKAFELYKNDDSTKLFCGTNTEITDRVEIQTSSFYPIIRTGETTPFTYYTFIQDSPLLESRNGKFEYNGVSVKMRDINETGWLSNEEKSIRKIDELIFITINNNQSVNTQQFNQTARHGSINLHYFRNLVTNNPDPEKILKFLNEYIQSNIFKKDDFIFLISFTLKQIKPTNPELNNKLLELAEAHLDPTEVEKLRTKIPPIWMDNEGSIDNEYLDTLIAARDSEGILKVFTEFLNSNEFKSKESKTRSIYIYSSSISVFSEFKPVNLELNEKLFELIKDNLGEYKERAQKYIKFLAEKGSKGGYRKRKTRYQKRLIKRKTQKKCRSRR